MLEKSFRSSRARRGFAHRVLGVVGLGGLATLGALLFADAVRSAPPPSADPFSVAAEVLETRCLKCHGESKQKGGLSLRTRESILEGGHSGSAIVPGDPGASLMRAAISYEDPDFEMPPTGRIPEAEIAALEAWIAAGAPWPEGRVLIAGDAPEDEIPTDRWCYAPLTRPATPDVRGVDWVTNPIDAFLLARLEAEGLPPAPRASRLELVRRITYDLTGLPPTPEEVRAFVASDDPEAYSHLVERLLASPQYGVRWGRHWLDLVRFAETDSYERDRLKPGAWRYRDWVIDAFNADLPYDRFLTEQLAGDELPDARLPQIIATGYHRLGIWDDEPADTEQAIYDDLDGILDTTCRVTMALSMGCARCHDHKGDPLPTTDYYRMLAFFEGLKPYKLGGGNATNPENFLRDVPADLGSDAFEHELAAYGTERAELIEHVKNLAGEIEARWGEETLAGSRSALERGLVRQLSFDGESEDFETNGTGFVEGKHGRALEVRGRDSGAEIPRPVADDFTISFWFRTAHPGAGGNRDLRWFRGTGLVDGEIPGIVADFGISLVGTHLCAGVGAPETFIHGPPGVTDGAWHHVAFTRERKSGTIELWLDGARVAQAIGGKQSLDAPKILRIGRMQPGHNSLRGAIDEVRFYDRPLSGAEIVDLAIEGGALPTVTTLIRDRLGAPEAARHERAVERLATLPPPTRKLIEVLCAQERGPEIAPSFVRVRGTASAKGEAVAAGFPTVLETPGLPPAPSIVATETTSGRRLAFAHWLTDPNHPLTARVMANRIWQHHFGRGIVRTSNDFGRFGELPTHPQLLDWLASEFMARGWSVKELHRVIVSSSAYRMSSRPSDLGLFRDPANDLFWRFEPRRLSAEELRDSVLAVNGTINLELGGPGVYPPLPKEVLATASRPDAAWGRSSPEQAARRSAYIHVKRSLLHPLLTSFDLADTDASCPVRFVTTQPTQALTLLNSEFSQRHAAHFADRLERECAGDLRAQVERGLELALQRPAEEEMVERQVEFIEGLVTEEEISPRSALELFCLLLFNLNEFSHLD